MKIPTNEECVREAIDGLGYISGHFAEVLVQLLPVCTRNGFDVVERALRRDGVQISDAEKNAMGLRKNAFMSREVALMLTEKGRGEPLWALQATLLRAQFYGRRYDDLNMIEQNGWKAKLSGRSDCAGCRKVQNKIGTPAQIEKMFPIQGCEFDACQAMVMPHFNST